MATVLITGGTGLIGNALTEELVKKNYDVIILTRDSSKANKREKVSYAEWDLNKGTIDKEAIANADYIIHLAGANVADKRWTAERKNEIRDSRIKSGHLIVKALTEIPNKVKAVLSSSAIGWYGPDPQIPNPQPFIETDPVSDDFLGATCKQWEDAIQPVTNLGKRLIIFRTGIVLSSKGGAYAEFKKPLNFKLATIMGSGKQIVSWIHIDDIVGLYLHGLQNETWNGVYNAVAPHPVSNKDLVKTMAAYSGMHLTIPAPEWALKLALGEMSIEVLKSATVNADKVMGEGYHFLYPSIKKAVENLKASPVRRLLII